MSQPTPDPANLIDLQTFAAWRNGTAAPATADRLMRQAAEAVAAQAVQRYTDERLRSLEAQLERLGGQLEQLLALRERMQAHRRDLLELYLARELGKLARRLLTDALASFREELAARDRHLTYLEARLASLEVALERATAPPAPAS